MSLVFSASPDATLMDSGEYKYRCHTGASTAASALLLECHTDCQQPPPVMRFANSLRLLAAFCGIASPMLAEAAKSFAGSNLYYAAGLSAAERTTLLKYVCPLVLLMYSN